MATFIEVLSLLADEVLANTTFSFHLNNFVGKFGKPP